MRESGADAHVFGFDAGALCLDFANTIGDRAHGAQEHLHAYSDLLAWARQAGLLTASEAGTLAGAARRRPAAAAAALAGAKAVRDAVYGIFSALFRDVRPAPDGLAALNAAAAAAFGHLSVTATRDGFRWTWRSPADALDGMLRPVVFSAAQLLVANDRPPVRECAGDACSWLFLDRSRARRRRWCSMTSCGNRDKVRRFYARRRARQTRRSAVGR